MPSDSRFCKSIGKNVHQGHDNIFAMLRARLKCLIKMFLLDLVPKKCTLKKETMKRKENAEACWIFWHLYTVCAHVVSWARCLISCEYRSLHSVTSVEILS